MTDANRSGTAFNVSRRAVLGGLGLGVAAMTTAAPAQARLDAGYEAMLMKCIDPRFTTNTWNYMTGRGWQNNYSEFAFAGGPVGVVARPSSRTGRKRSGRTSKSRWTCTGSRASSA
jgi:hypothetical protein